MDNLAYRNGWRKVTNPKLTNGYMVSYRRGDYRLNFFLTTGTCGSFLEHPTQGKTALFRRNIDDYVAEEIFKNPRVHTDGGYKLRKNRKKKKKATKVKGNEPSESTTGAIREVLKQMEVETYLKYY